MRTKNASRKIAVTVSVALAFGTPLIAHSDVIALQIATIPGDAKFATNQGLPSDSIRVLTVGNSVENNTGGCSGGGGCAGKAVFSGISIVKKFGESSAPLFLAVAQGRHFPTATLSFYRVKSGAPIRYYTITLEDVSIAVQAWVGNSNAVDAADSENIELEYAKITLFDDATGSQACFDVRLNEAC